MPIDERKNIVGTIAEEELFLLNYVGAWTQFTCVNREEKERMLWHPLFLLI